MRQNKSATNYLYVYIKMLPHSGPSFVKVRFVWQIVRRLSFASAGSNQLIVCRVANILLEGRHYIYVLHTLLNSIHNLPRYSHPSYLKSAEYRL